MMTTANYHPDMLRPPARFELDLSDKPTNEQVITHEDWAAIPGLLGLPEVDALEWEICGPSEGSEIVRRDGKWILIGPTGRFTTPLAVVIAICDLAIPLLTARDSRVPEVGQ